MFVHRPERRDLRFLERVFPRAGRVQSGAMRVVLAANAHCDASPNLIGPQLLSLANYECASRILPITL